MKPRYIIFALTAILLVQTKSNAQEDTNWVKTNTWYFDNFVKDTLPWSLFRETYIGVAPSPAGDFDQLFYEYLYKTKLASSGLCFGMDVLAMLMKKNGGYLGYCHPPYVYSGTIFTKTTGVGVPSNDTIGPADRNLKTVIAMVHGNQINHGFLLFLLDVVALGKSRDGNYAFDQVNYYLAQDDPPVISITKGLSPADGGHVLIPYVTKDMGTTRRIYVYDPNRSFYKPGNDGHNFYTLGNNYIEIGKSSGSWKFDMGNSSASDYWSGDPGNGGNCIVIPLSIAGKRDRLPQSLVAEAAYTLNTIFIFGDVKVEQISNPFTGLQYLSNDGNNIENDPQKRLNSIIPFIPMDGNPSSPDAINNNAFFFRGTEPLKLQFRALGAYRIGIIYKGKYVEVKGTGTGEVQNFFPDNF